MEKIFPTIRLAALDLDGTLLNHKSDITPRTRQAIAKAIANGVIIVPATGRALANVPPVVASLPDVRYALTSNGAAVWDLGDEPQAAVYSRYANAAQRHTTEPKCLVRRYLPTETARMVFEAFCDYEGELSVFGNGFSYKSEDGIRRAAARFAARGSTEAMQPNDGRFIAVRDFTEWMSRHAHEIEKFCMFFDTEAEAKAALPRFTAMSGVEVVQGAPNNVEVTAAGVDKGEGLLALAAHLGIPREQTLAVGDSENDRAMLQKAGVAAVMANGMPHIKRLADIVSEADCDHDGVAELFERLNMV